MNIRPGGSSGLQIAYAVGRFEGCDDAFVVNQSGGESPLGSVLCSMGSDYAVHVNPDGSGKSVCAGLDLTSPRGDGRAFFIRDSASGEVWSPFSLPTNHTADEYEVSYLPGQMSVYSLKNKIACTLTIATIPGRNCEIWRVKVENRSASERTIAFTTYIEPCMGPELESGYLDKHGALLLGRPLSAMAGDRGRVQDTVLFHSSTLTPVRFETRKASFIGEGRTLRNPVHMDSVEHSGEDGLCNGAIASLTVEVELPIEGEAEFGFCLGVAASAEQALRVVTAHSKMGNVTAAIESSIGCWQDLTSAVHVRSSDRAADAIVNTWLPYEAYAAWIGQRTGGVCLDPSRAADAIRRMYALCGAAPDQCRDGLLAFAGGISVTGTYTPDAESVVTLPPGEMLWLPACVAHYVAETGDVGLLAEEVGAGTEPKLTVGEHCERIIRLCLASGHPVEGMLKRTIHQWSLTEAASAEFDKFSSSPKSRGPISRDEPPEQRSLPRRVRYFQSLTPLLAEGKAVEELERLFTTDLCPHGDSGAACCAYWVLVESILGLEATAQGLRLRPDLPSSWLECEITRRFRDDTYAITITRAPQTRKSATAILVDGEPVLGDMLPYFGDGLEHKVEVVLS